MVHAKGLKEQGSNATGLSFLRYLRHYFEKLQETLKYTFSSFIAAPLQSKNQATSLQVNGHKGHHGADKPRNRTIRWKKNPVRGRKGY